MLKYTAHPQQLECWLKLRDALDLIRRIRKDLTKDRLGHIIVDRAEDVIQESLRTIASFREHDFHEGVKKTLPQRKKRR